VRVAGLLHANWLTNKEFDLIVNNGKNLDSDDYIKYRCAKFLDGYDQRRVDHAKSYRAKIPGLQVGIDVAYADIVVNYAAKFKELGFDFVEYNIENAFDGPNTTETAQSNVDKIGRASEAVHAQGMKFRLAPGRPNTNTWIRTGLLDDVAKLVDYYHIQNQTVQDVSNEEYAGFTEKVAKALRAANSKILVTSQVAAAQGAQPGKTVQQTMRDVIYAAMTKPPPGNTDGVALWIRSGDVEEAKAFFTWFRQTFPGNNIVSTPVPSPSPPSSQRPRPPQEADCVYCGKPIRWQFHEEYNGWRSIDFDTGKEHECDPISSDMLITRDIGDCKNCGKLVRWEPAPESKEGRRAYEIYFYPDVQHRCAASKDKGFSTA
jgi:hypothetical protein